jgi:glycosyltransferase involved in cell wall biosynthesis
MGISVAPWVKSGYGHQAGEFFPRIAKTGRDVTIYAYRGLIGASLDWPTDTTEDKAPVHVVPQGRMSQFGFEILPFYHDQCEADYILSIGNLFMFDGVKQLIARQGWPWYHLAPIDCAPLGAPDQNLFNITGIHPVAISRHGQTMLHDAGFEDVPYLPHSIDTNLFRPPTEAERASSRQAMGLTEDNFLIAINAANESSADRKALTQQLLAFASCYERHPNWRLYIHTALYRHPIGLDLTSQLTRLGIEDVVMYPDPDIYNTASLSFSDLCSLVYWPADVLSNTAKAEGFGLTPLEAQACGVPVIVSNNSAMTEVSAPGEYGGYRVPGQREWSNLDSSYWMTPFVADIESAYEQFHLAWKNDDLYPSQQAARVHALQYDSARVFQEHWLPFLSMVEDSL